MHRNYISIPSLFYFILSIIYFSSCATTRSKKENSNQISFELLESFTEKKFKFIHEKIASCDFELEIDKYSKSSTKYFYNKKDNKRYLSVDFDLKNMPISNSERPFKPVVSFTTNDLEEFRSLKAEIIEKYPDLKQDTLGCYLRMCDPFITCSIEYEIDNYWVWFQDVFVRNSRENKIDEFISKTFETDKEDRKMLRHFEVRFYQKIKD